MTTTTGNLTTLAYETAGTGTPVVLLHGLTFDRTSWRPIVDELDAAVHTIAIDLPAHGDSPGPPTSIEAAHRATARPARHARHCPSPARGPLLRRRRRLDVRGVVPLPRPGHGRQWAGTTTLRRARATSGADATGAGLCRGLGDDRELARPRPDPRTRSERWCGPDTASTKMWSSATGTRCSTPHRPISRRTSTPSARRSPCPCWPSTATPPPRATDGGSSSGLTFASKNIPATATSCTWSTPLDSPRACAGSSHTAQRRPEQPSAPDNSRNRPRPSGSCWVGQPVTSSTPQPQTGL